MVRSHLQIGAGAAAISLQAREIQQAFQARIPHMADGAAKNAV